MARPRGWTALVALLAAASASASAAGPVAYWRAPAGAFVHLFEWPWDSVARECEEVLGPAGYAAVQVSPPQEHVLLEGDPWWTRYQPVSYQLEGRSGTRDQFAAMVARCRQVGVGVYVDVVMNHMSGMESGAGSAGTGFSHYQYPGTWQPQDFHHCGRYGDDDLRNYQDRYEVQACELLNLADLDTGAPAVRARLQQYLADLRSLGVAGFRIDAAKHMDAGEIRAVLDGATGGAVPPYVFQEVIDLGNEPIRAHEYFPSGAVTELRYGFEMQRVFDGGQLAWLEHFGEAWGLMDATKAVAFTDNHDNQRGHGAAGGVLTHRHGRLYELANAFMLAWPYGYPKVMSSYRFEDPNQGPPMGPDRRVGPVQDAQGRCREPWVCEHRWPAMRAMARLRRVAQGAPVARWWSNGAGQIAFAREGRAFVALNREPGELQQRLATGLPPGEYCEVVRPDGACGGRLRVDAQGRAEIRVPPMDVRAWHLEARP